jgi:hypothetical protein
MKRTVIVKPSMPNRVRALKREIQEVLGPE